MKNRWLEIKLPQNPHIVYLIFAGKNNTKKVIYVGKCGKYVGRFGDYIAKHFKASTDFKVGTAIRYLQKKGFDIIIKYKTAENMNKEERNLINKYKMKTILLNNLKGYDYRRAVKREEESKIKRFVDTIMEQFK